MANRSSAWGTPERFASGIAGLDEVLKGGLFKAGIYIVSGRPGAGKTIFGNQICFHHANRGERALYVTLLAETHTQMLMHMQSLSFFDSKRIGESISYVSAYTTIEREGLDGLLKLLRSAVREQRVTLL